VKYLFIIFIAFLSTSAMADTIEVDIKWTGGYGQKDLAFCPDGYYATKIANKDWGRHDQSAYQMVCERMSDFLPSVNTSFSGCEVRSVDWWGGPGEKIFSICPQGKFATGFSNFDHGNHDQSVNQMRCCGLVDGATHNNTVTVQVPWWGGKGPKPAGECPAGYYITAIKNKDYGNHDQAVVEIQCSQPW